MKRYLCGLVALGLLVDVTGVARPQPSYVFTVTSTDDTGLGTLRQAILDANATPGPCTINFSIDSGLQTIRPATALPTVTNPVTLDATTQPGYSGKPVIVLDGTRVGPFVNGLTISGGNSMVEGLVISSFTGSGIVLQTSGGNVLVGNFIGTDLTGTGAAGNSLDGVTILGPSGGNTISRNIISGNGTAGVGGSGIFINGSTGNLVQDNYVGTDVTGTRTLPNAYDGVAVAFGASSNKVASNVISGNGTPGFGGSGIFINNNASQNLVQGNHIGTDMTGMISLPNAYQGVAIDFGHCDNNMIGGTMDATANVIAYNHQDGVRVSSGIQNAILHNSIYANGLLGIQLANNGNDNQAFPLLTSATSNSSGTTVQGSLTSTPNTTFTLEFFANGIAIGSGSDQGEEYLTSVTTTTDGTGYVSFTAVLQPVARAGLFITATATDPTNNTSQFSPSVEVNAP